MDSMLWVAMSGAKENFHSLSVRSNNLANANTTGFKAEFENTRAMSVFGNAYPTRAFAMTEVPGYNFQGGAMQTTGRTLDVAIQGDGFFAVADAQGNEAYTRYGNLALGPDGVLHTSNGLDVLDEAGNQIVLPMPLAEVNINSDGYITGKPLGADSDVVETYQRIKMVKPDLTTLEKGYDGLFRSRDGATLQMDNTAQLQSGMLEASNVNPVEELTSLIRVQRQYEAQIKMMQAAGDMDDQQNRLLAYD
ncbi:MAG TPA: flagellar basal-body rod protein FlgF [Candidatus Anaerobiospirillum stercoravium]|nr:flagellar basal-body rod protein FlgF [Candidatus Anaerobiospirillum stercoravium]